MIPILLDENVSLRAAARLRERGYTVLAVAELPERGVHDEAVFTLAKKNGSLLITRDYHFTNSLRFPASAVGGILFLSDGNLKADDEALLIDGFLANHPQDFFQGRLVSLSPQSARIR